MKTGDSGVSDSQRAALSAKGASFAVVVSRFNGQVTDKLLAGARDALLRHGATETALHVVYVPGALEIPLTAALLAESERYDAVICLGAVIRGETAHFDVVARESARGIADVALATATPVINGVLTTDTLAQALERAGGAHGNKGLDAALAAMEMVDVVRDIVGE